MSVWVYQAVTSVGRVETGQLAGDSPSAVRASLRRVGLTVVDIRQVGSKRSAKGSSGATWLTNLISAHRRRRRTELKAEMFDAVSTMLDAGLPLLQATEASLSSSGIGSRTATRTMLTSLREALRGGASMSEAMRLHATWFDATECAIVEAGQHRGELAYVLRSLSERHRRANELGQRLIGIMTYPAVVAIVGVGVVIFLSTETLPDLVGILRSAKLEAPALTTAVMSVGSWLASYWAVILIAFMAIGAGVFALLNEMTKRGIEWPMIIRRAVPSLARRLAIARFAEELAEMTRAGVPVVDAMRLLAPSFASPVTASLGRRLASAADSIEQGGTVDGTLVDPLWFDAELRNLICAGQASGELADMLARLAAREQRRAARLVDRLASVLEPTVILLLALVVGIIAMSAVQPLLRMQEIF